MDGWDAPGVDRLRQPECESSPVDGGVGGVDGNVSRRWSLNAAVERLVMASPDEDKGLVTQHISKQLES